MRYASAVQMNFICACGICTSLDPIKQATYKPSIFSIYFVNKFNKAHPQANVEELKDVESSYNQYQ
jgi:hypothetical protein